MGTREKTALIVDDNADLRALLKVLLEAEGYTVECAADGREALAVQRRRFAPLVITDLFMPESDGFELIGALRAEFESVRIVVMSGDQDRFGDSYLKTAALIGADGVLLKPFGAVQVIEMLDKVAR